MTLDEARAFVVEATKDCAGCGRTLPVGDFYRSSTGRGGRDSRCKSCRREADTTSTERTRKQRERNQPRAAAVPFDPDRWRDHAACRDMPGQFHPHPTETEDVDACLAVCAGCPVAGPCLDFAIGTNQSEGVWGGMTESERRVERRRRAWERRSGAAS